MYNDWPYDTDTFSGSENYGYGGYGYPTEPYSTPPYSGGGNDFWGNAFQTFLNQFKTPDYSFSDVANLLWQKPLHAIGTVGPTAYAVYQAKQNSDAIDPGINQLAGLSNQLVGDNSFLAQSTLQPYDQQTTAGRNALLKSNQQRGISGSTFGAQSLDNYNFLRKAGRTGIEGSNWMTAATNAGKMLGDAANLKTKSNLANNALVGTGIAAGQRYLDDTFRAQQQGNNQKSGQYSDLFGLSELYKMANSSGFNYGDY